MRAGQPTEDNPMRRFLSFILVLLVAACAAGPGVAPQQATTLPTRNLLGAGDPTRSAILQAAAAFRRPAALQGRPDAAARAIAMLEHLAVTIPADQTFRAFNPMVAVELAQGRDEFRRLLGIAPGAAPQAVINAMLATSEALGAGDRAAAARALPPGVAPDAAATLARLDALPDVPIATRGTARAQSELMDLDRPTQAGR
jgi:hypothetical protein